MNQRVVIFANPIAGRGKGRVLAEGLRDRFGREGWEARLAFDRPAEVSEETVAGATAVVSIGGDGTLRSVVERVTAGGETEGPGVLVVPMGTANLMGKHLGLPAAGARGFEERAVAAIGARKLARLDVGRICGRSANGEAVEQLFLLMVGIGLDGEIVHALDRVRKGPIGFVSYLRPALETLAGYRFREIEVEVDGRVVWPMGSAIAFAGNVAEYGTGFPILPLAKSDDELLDVCVLPLHAPTDLIEHAVAMVAGEHHVREGTVYVKGRRVVVRSKEAVAVQADGDPAGFTPVEMELLKVRVAFLT
jgi:diacylglycerol kinase family enzyme